MATKQRVAILGSSGSIGTSALDVMAAHPDRLAVVGLAVHSRIDLLEQQIARCHPQMVAVVDEQQAASLAQRQHGACQVLSGIDGMIHLATHPEVDTVLIGTSGPDALIPLIRAIEAGKRIALASKELLVMAGELIMTLVRRHGVTLIPIDSEHAALFQILQGVPQEQVERIIVTGSGGSLWGMDAVAMTAVTPPQVLSHPKWQMGPKITVDSATLMNKGLEIIEAHWLFDLPLDRIKLLIHPEAAVHAIVELTDGTCLAQMSICDMRLPIQFAFSFPDRWPVTLPRLRLAGLAGWHFIEPDVDRYPCLRLALEAARVGGSACTVLSAANDTAVWAYLQGTLAFMEIPRVIDETLRQHEPQPHPTLPEIQTADAWARAMARELITRRSRSVLGASEVAEVPRGHAA